MSGWVVILGPLVLDGPAAACPEGDPSCASSQESKEAPAAAPDPGRSARRADLVGPGACSWTTEMVAQRVLEEGTPWSYVGRLIPAPGALPSRVAAPFTIGPEASIHVVANEILEDHHTRNAPGGRWELVGRALEVDGTRYFVTTSIRVAGS
jgi:hypothetical protein